jgi:hypothetical protein
MIRKKLKIFWIGVIGYVLTCIYMGIAKPLTYDIVHNTIYYQDWVEYGRDGVSTIGRIFLMTALYGMVSLLFNIAKEKREY